MSATFRIFRAFCLSVCLLCLICFPGGCSFNDSVVEAEVEDVRPGQRQITTPPSSVQPHDSGLAERPL